jgi:predicted NBD/HSP70 family sugar kinase
VCLQQIADGLAIACGKAGVALSDIAAVGLDTPGPASATGVLSARGSTNFVHADWSGFDIRAGLEAKLGIPVTYLNDANAAALWGHFATLGPDSFDRDNLTSVSVIVGTGNGGGVVVNGRIISGRNGFGGELGHVLVPYQSIPGTEGLRPECNCGRIGDLESVCSLTGIQRNLLPYFLQRFPNHELANAGAKGAKLVRGLAEKGDPMCREIFRVQANALGLFFDEMVNTFDPDILIVGGGAIETGPEFQEWFLGQIHAGMPAQRVEQAGIPIRIMPNGDTAGARGAAIRAFKKFQDRRR